ncbi:hypothetical protein JOQ06_023856 [Pogonophryne albipinna]|uniref:DDE Tnp4 domain-containing protein n=1 Tax=Pogonophryne albipinna TaxID=1090488 RepID=A0AAD6FSF5_9TELE|nr:hypothetical protein JOQ06_023856 [Pogonophryne albipinna]
MDVDPIAILNPHVPVLAVFFDGQKDLMQDHRLGRQSLEALLRILPSKMSTVCRLVHTGVEKIAALRQEVIKLPPPGELEEVGQGFARLANSPVSSRCVGAIDGCHAVCDGKGFFVGYPGSVHDTRVLKNSAIYKQALYPPSGFFLLGDGGYPCMEVPVAPYREPLQGRVQSRFNQHHARARSIVERAFGMMKTRWRLLFFKALEVHHTFVPSVITACAVLHNICLTAGDILEPEEDVGDIGVVPPRLVRGDRGEICYVHQQKETLSH